MSVKTTWLNSCRALCVAAGSQKRNGLKEVEFRRSNFSVIKLIDIFIRNA